MIEVPFFSIKKAPQVLREEWFVAVQEVIASGQFVGGPIVGGFENSWAKTVGVNHAVGVGNGLDGLVIALKALGIGQGDLVAVPAHTFIATWNAVSIVGATPVGIDVDECGLMDLDQLEASQLNLKCVIPVHMHGAMVDIKRLMTWASQKDIRVIEDASQSHMATHSGINAGQGSDVGVFSLYPTKNLGALGDAGIVVTNSLDLATKMRSYANYGASPADKYTHESFGVNSRLDAVQAAVLNVNLRHLESWTLRRREIADLYISNISENEHISIQNKKSDSSVWHHFAITTRTRDELMNHLRMNGISTEIHYPNTAADEFFRISETRIEIFPNASRIAESILSLPMSPWHTNEEILYVCSALNSFDPGI